MDTSGLLPLYRWDDGGSIQRILTTDALLEIGREDPDVWEQMEFHTSLSSLWTGLRPESEPTFVVFAPGDRPRVFYFEDGDVGCFRFLWIPSPSALSNHPMIERIGSRIWPFAEALLWPPGFVRVPSSVVWGSSGIQHWGVFRESVFLPDEIYVRARAFPDPSDPEIVRRVFGDLVADFRQSSPGEFDYYTLVVRIAGGPRGDVSMVVQRTATGWTLSWLGGPHLAVLARTFPKALLEAASTSNRPRLLPASQRQAELDRIGIQEGTPLIDRRLFESYWILGVKTPLLWPTAEFLAWYEAQEPS